MCKTKKILALSGGGFRGLFTIRVLQKLEKHTGKPIAEQFSLIAGTSIGGIIALAIAAGIPLKEVESEFINNGNKIFPTPIKRHIKNPFKRYIYKLCTFIIKPCLYLKAIFFPIHTNKGLKDSLKAIFGDMKIADLKHNNIIIPSANLKAGSPKHFKTPHHPDLSQDKERRVVDVALATSAAPVYFPIHKIEEIQTSYADGGLIGNAPGLFGWLEAKTKLGIDEEDLCILSVGTLAGRPSLSGKARKNQGVLFWLSPPKLRLLTYIMAQQEQQTHYMLNLLLGEKKYHRIDSPLSDEAALDIELDDTSEYAQETLISQAEKHFDDFSSTSFCKEHFPREE